MSSKLSKIVSYFETIDDGLTTFVTLASPVATLWKLYDSTEHPISLPNGVL